MKTINISFEDEEHKKLVKKKGALSWRQFILKLLNNTDAKGGERA